MICPVGVRWHPIGGVKPNPARVRLFFSAYFHARGASEARATTLTDICLNFGQSPEGLSCVRVARRRVECVRMPFFPLPVSGPLVRRVLCKLCVLIEVPPELVCLCVCAIAIQRGNRDKNVPREMVGRRTGKIAHCPWCVLALCGRASSSHSAQRARVRHILARLMALITTHAGRSPPPSGGSSGVFPPRASAPWYDM